jgi:hypothetical protein
MTNRTPRNLAWLAGLCEGEAYFCHRNGSPMIKLDMTDLDVLQRAAVMFDTKVNGPRQPKGKPSYKPVWSVRVSGYRAIGWMMTLYTFLGERRRGVVREAIASWNAAPGHARKVRGENGKVLPAICHPDRPLHARQKCAQCYGSDYMREWRKRRKAA